MIVTFTPERLRYLERIVDGFVIGDIDPVQISPARFEVELPAVAWLWVYERMLDDVYNLYGNKRSEVKRYEAGALRAVRTELNFRERHPALRSVGMLGWRKEILPVWREDDDLWSPYPNGDVFFVLVPQHRMVQGRRATLWSPGDPPVHSPLFEEREHLRFGLEVHGGRIEHQARS